MKQSSLDSFFNIKYKNKENLNKTLIKDERTSIFNPKTPNNTPNYSSTDTDKLTDKLSDTINAFKLNDNLPKYILRFDGASKGNPGKSGAGAVLYENGKEIWNISRYLGIRTNNYAECFAMVLGIQEAFIRKINELHVEGDSLLIINQLKGKWKINNKDLKTMHLSIIQMIKSFNIITFTHIYRNYNNRADELANLCIK